MPARYLFLALLFAGLAGAQRYDVVLAGGPLLHPANGVRAGTDVAVSRSPIPAIQARIDPAEARKRIDVSGLYVVPGLIDLHAHVFGYPGALRPDDTALIAGTTTIVDAGGSGWRTFDRLRRTVAEQSQTRVLAL